MMEEDVKISEVAEALMADVERVRELHREDVSRWAQRAITAEVKLAEVVKALGEIEAHLGQVRVTQPTGDHVDDALYIASCARIKALAKEA
jgi:hypothetical protein